MAQHRKILPKITNVVVQYHTIALTNIMITYIFLLLFLFLLDLSMATTWKLNLLDPTLYPRAQCLDGSQGGYYVNPSKSTSSSLYIHHEGGGWCQTQTKDGKETWPNDNCQDRALGSLGSTVNATQTYDFSTNSMGCAGCSEDPVANPLMHDWNKVLILYCDGTSFSSSNDDRIDGLHFNGLDILNAVQDDLSNKIFTDLSEVVIGGSSAGGLAVYLHLDWWAEKLASVNPAMKVVGLPDGGFFLDYTVAATSNYSYDADLRQGFNDFNCKSGVNQLCVASKIANNQPVSDCYFAEHTLPFITTPIFIFQTVFDSWQLQWENGMADPIDYNALNAYGASLENSMQTAIESNQNNVVGGFIDRCFHHCTTDELLGTTPVILGRTMAQGFASFWLDPLQTMVIWKHDEPLPCEDCDCPAGMDGPAKR